MAILAGQVDAIQWSNGCDFTLIDQQPVYGVIADTRQRESEMLFKDGIA